jgi:phosphate transport system substrate-binding protein
MAVASGAFSSSDTPDPRLLAKQSPPPRIESPPALEPAVGSLASLTRPTAPAAPAAPLAESQATHRMLQEKARELRIVIGKQAKSSFDTTVQRAFEQTLTRETVSTTATSDREAVEHLMVGRAHFGLIGGKLSAREIRAGLRQTQIGIELFALSVSPLSSVRSLSESQVRQIFTGQVTNWEQLGYDPAPILPIVPREQRLAERAQRTLMPGDSFAESCVRASSERQVAEQILRDRGAIGIIRVTAEPRESGHKLVQIGWTPPTAAAFGYGTYTFGIPLQLVTSGEPDERAMSFIRFSESEHGRALLARTLTFAR